MTPMTLIIISSICICLFCLAISLFSLLITMVNLLFIRHKAKQFNDIINAFEKAFSCKLLGSNPHIDIFDYEMGDKMWMIPCRDREKQDKLPS